MSFYALILAGGVGTRLWPMSRKERPKYLLDPLGSGSSLLQQAVARVEPLADSVWVMTSAATVAAVARQVPQAHVIAEPSARGTMPPLAACAALIASMDHDAVIGSFAADHVVRDEDAFVRAVSTAVQAAGDGSLVTIGITPTEPSSAFGYIKVALSANARRQLLSLDQSGSSAYPVRAFVEKPDAARAAAYMASGQYVWNAGIFVARADALLRHIHDLVPDLDPLTLKLGAQLSERMPRPGRGSRSMPLPGAAGVEAFSSPDIRRMWDALEPSVIDIALAEPLAEQGMVKTVPVSMGWSDVGDWAAVTALYAAAHGTDSGTYQHRTDPGEVHDDDSAAPVFRQNAEGTFVLGSHKPIAVVGIHDAAIVDMDDVLLVVSTKDAQQVKDIIRDVDRAGRSDLL